MAFIDSSVVNVALPKVESDLQATLPSMMWVTNAYTLCLSALLLIGGATADKVGRRRIFVLGIVLFALASLGCGLAPGVEVLVVARGIQGVGAALLIPCSLAIIGATFSEQERGAAIGIWSGASAIAAGGSPLLGGWLVDHVTWRSIFLVNPVLAIPAILIAVRHVTESIEPDARKGLDATGAALVFGGLGLLVYGLIAAADRGWRDAAVDGSLAAGVIFLAGFVLVERGSRSPMVPLGVFRSLTFTGVNLLTLFLYGALGGVLFYLPFLLIQVHGYSATAAGAVFLPFTVVLAVLSKWGGGLVARFGARLPLITGPTVVGVGFMLLSLPGTGGSYWATFLLPMVVIGLGMAITVAPLTTTVLNSVPGHQTGVASGINNAVAQIASLLLIAILGSVGIATLNRALDERAARVDAGPEVRDLVNGARHGLVMPLMPESVPQTARQAARAIIAESFVDTIRRVMLIGATLAFASALTAAITIRRERTK